MGWIVETKSNYGTHSYVHLDDIWGLCFKILLEASLLFFTTFESDLD